MRKEWFSSKELTAIDGLPTTTQGVNRKARVEKWQSRKRSGVQGKAIEYHIDSLPEFVRHYMKIKESPENMGVSPTEPARLWLSAYFQLTEKEQHIVLNWLVRNGLRDLLAFIALVDKDKMY